MANPTLTLSRVPASLIVGLENTSTLVTNTYEEQKSWKLDVNPAVGLTVSPPSGSLDSKKTTSVTITPILAGHYSITLTGTTGAEVSGSPVPTVAIDPAVQRYQEVLADLETLKF